MLFTDYLSVGNVRHAHGLRTGARLVLLSTT